MTNYFDAFIMGSVKGDPNRKKIIKSFEKYLFSLLTNDERCATVALETPGDAYLSRPAILEAQTRTTSKEICTVIADARKTADDRMKQAGN